MLKLQERIVLRNCGIIDPENLKHYIARGGFTGLVKALELRSAGSDRGGKDSRTPGPRGSRIPNLEKMATLQGCTWQD